MKKEKQRGNGFFTELVAKGLALGQRTRRFDKMKQYALSQYEEGPRQVHTADAYAIVENLESLLLKAKVSRLADDCTDDLERYLYRSRLDKTVDAAIQAYLRASGKWYSNSIDNLRNLKKDHSAFYLLVLDYLKSNQNARKIEIAMEMIDIVREELLPLMT